MSDATRYAVTAIGELLVDFVSLPTAASESAAETARHYQAHPGGAPANVVSTVRRFGRPAAFIGSVGDDQFGRLLIHSLETHGVDTSGMAVTDRAFTTLAFVTHDPDGDRHFDFARKPGADTLLQLNDTSRDILARTDILHFGTLSLSHDPSRQATREAVRLVREAGGIISFDPNVRAPLWRDPADLRAAWEAALPDVHILKISEDDLALLTPGSADDAIRRLLHDTSIRLVLLTLGAKGCRIYRRDGRAVITRDVPGVAGVRAVDTTGAGDIFTGAFLSSLPEAVHDAASLTTWLGADPDDALIAAARIANRVAADSTTRRGGISSIPDAETIQAWRERPV